MLSSWFEVLQKVMNMWETNADLSRGSKYNSKPSSSTSVQSSNTANLDADDYYVFIYDEEDKASNQGVIKQGNRGYKRASQRVLGFWCFSPGVGFRKV